MPYPPPIARKSAALLRFTAKADAGGKEFRADLSAVAAQGDCLWLASDETATIKRLAWTGSDYAEPATYALADFLDLPGDADEEVDIEGLAVDGGYLWLTGSHSRVRKGGDRGEVSREAWLDELDDIRDKPSRHVVARIPLGAADGQGRCALVRETEDGRRAALLRPKGRGNELSHAAAKDPHFGPFLKVPAKENGFDIEGLAVRGDRAWLGMRGPVVRRWAVILEIALDKAKESGLLRLRKRGGEKYRKHFVDLGGLGVRDLAADGDDILILAGPTLAPSGPVALYRWPGALASDEPPAPERLCLLPHGDGCDHIEGITLRPGPDGGRELLAVYDSPDPARLHGAGGIDADLFALPD
ncbi:MAG TPA: DUF3616 domain-containing protein [Alphaproteobacteria bacterium]|nr:DUF3616 domain-containing protein [Alphaproteobacteria bacterium]